MARSSFTTVDRYVESFPQETKEILQKIRTTVKKELPSSVTEAISYGIPTFKLSGRYVIYFAGFKNHVSLYPIPDGPVSFKKKISKYVAGKGTIKFPLDEKIPYELVGEVARQSLESYKKRTKGY